MSPSTTLPVALRRELDAGALCREDPCDGSTVLGSFWPNSRTSFESCLVKTFKECCPTNEFEPHISALCEFYADLILNATGGAKFDWVVRVLSSSEKECESSRAQSLLADMLCRRTGARNATDLFFKSETRPPMRTVDRLSGPDALQARVHYVLQDLFMKPHRLGGAFLLVDDICNVGASMRVYASALRQFACAENVYAVNLAATRFRRGKDGHGLLKLDVSGLPNRPGLREVWLDSVGTFHTTPDCQALEHPISCGMRFMAERKAKPCSVCFCEKKPKRKWWQLPKG